MSPKCRRESVIVAPANLSEALTGLLGQNASFESHYWDADDADKHGRTRMKTRVGAGAAVHIRLNALSVVIRVYPRPKNASHAAATSLSAAYARRAGAAETRRHCRRPVRERAVRARAPVRRRAAAARVHPRLPPAPPLRLPSCSVCARAADRGGTASTRRGRRQSRRPG